MKTILLVNDHYQFGGGGDAVLRFEERILERHGYKVCHFSFVSEVSGDNTNNYSYVEKKSSVQKKIQKFIGDKDIDKAFLNTLESINPDLIHIHLISKYPLSIYKNLEGYKVIQTLHGPNMFCASSWGGLKNGAPCELGIGIKCYKRGCVTISMALLYHQLQTRCWKTMKNNVGLFHCPSRQLYSHVKRLGLKNSQYIPLGIDHEYHKIVTKIENERLIILFVGAMVEQKGIKVLIEAMRIVVKNNSNVLLKLTGRGKLESWVIEKVNKYGLEDNVQLLGFVDHNKVRGLYIEADIFVLPSIWHEQFGLVGPEALACKTPCVGSNIGGIPEWLHHNEWGLLVPPNEVNDLAFALNTLVDDPKMRKKFGENGREFVLEEYGAKKYENNILKMISSVLN